jgi:hypothetical protein
LILSGLLFGMLAAGSARAEFQAEPWSGELSHEHHAAALQLRQARSKTSAPDRIVQALAQLGSPAIPALVEILCVGRVPPAADTDAPMLLSEPQTRLVVSALRQLPRAQVRNALEERLSVHPVEVRTALGGIDLLAEIGEVGDLDRMLALVPLREDGQPTRDARQRVVPALARWIGREPKAFEHLNSSVRRTSKGPARLLADALGASRDVRAVKVLFACARQFPDLAPACVAQLRTLPRCHAPELCAWMAGELTFAAPEYARMLCVALPRYDDGAALGALVQALDHGDGKVRDAAQAALREVSGLALPAQAADWQRWLDDQYAWQESRLPALVEAVRTGSLSQAIAAVRELGTARIARLAVAEGLVLALGRPEPALWAMTVEMLAALEIPDLCAQLGSALDAHPLARARLCGGESARLRQP